MDTAPDVQELWLPDGGKVDRQRLVEGEGAVSVLVSDGDGALFPGGDLFAGPFGLGAAAGGHDFQDGERRGTGVVEGEGAFLRSVRQEDVSEIMDGLVDLHTFREGDGLPHEPGGRFRDDGMLRHFLQDRGNVLEQDAGVGRNGRGIRRFHRLGFRCGRGLALPAAPAAAGGQGQDHGDQACSLLSHGDKDRAENCEIQK